MRREREIYRELGFGSKAERVRSGAKSASAHFKKTIHVSSKQNLRDMLFHVGSFQNRREITEIQHQFRKEPTWILLYFFQKKPTCFYLHRFFIEPK